MARTRLKRSFLKHTLFLAAVALAATSMSGCNTARGFGQDVQKLGNAISHSAS